MILRIFVLLGLLLLPFPALAGTLHEKRTIEDPSGRIRYFHYYVPKDLTDRSPMVILLHGGSQDYTGILKKSSAHNEWLTIAEQKKIFLVIPNGLNPKTKEADGANQHWNDCRADAREVETGADDVGFISNLIDWAIQKYDVDASRIYVTGASNGGTMSYRLAAELSDRIAAIGVFVANLPKNSECKEPGRPISVFICNGTKDTWMPWNGGQVIKGGEVYSAYQTRDFWIRHNSTSTTPVTKQYQNVDRQDGSTVRSELYANGKRSTEVMFYSVKGGGHTIPSIQHLLRPIVERIVGPQNHDIESTIEVWNFLSRHKLRL